MTQLGQAAEDVVAVLQGGRHQLRGLGAGVAEHDALVAGAFVLLVRGVHALGDVGRLAVQVVGVLGLLPVEALLLVADVLDRGADLGLQRAEDVLGQLLVGGLVAARLAGPHFARQDDAVGGDQGLAGDARFGVGAQEGVDDGVADPIGDLVRMAFGNAFTGEDVGRTAQGSAPDMTSPARTVCPRDHANI
jgi:hypothetical protein